MDDSSPVVIASNQTSIPINGTVTATGPLTDAQLRATPVPVSTTQLPAALVGGRLNVNIGAWLGSTAPGVGQNLMASSIPVVLATDHTVISVSGPNDWRRNSTPKRYSISLILTPGAAAALTNLMGLRKQAANADVYIIRLRVTVFHAAAGVAATFGFKRATTVAGGTLIAAADVPKLDTSAANATLEVRTGAVTFGAEAAQYILTGPAHTTAAPAAGVGSSFDWEWRANDRAGSIRLTGDEGIIMENITAGDVDNRFYVTVEWEEA